MGSAKFDYNWEVQQQAPSFGDWMSDVFLGTKKLDTKNADALLNYQMKYNEYMMDKANEFNVNMANNANAFAEKMSNTAYQRAVQDMVQAGINPAIAFNQGAKAASSPSGASIGSAMASSPASHHVKTDFANGIIGKTTAKVVNSAVDNFLNKTINKEENLKDWLNIFAKFV